MGYQARWPGKDLVGGLKSDGRRYTWTEQGLKLNPGVFGVGSSFTGRYAEGGRPIYERELSTSDVVRAIWRLDKFPEKFKRLRWRGFLSPGNVKQLMAALDWGQEFRPGQPAHKSEGQWETTLRRRWFSLGKDLVNRFWAWRKF